jgi:Ran GTPase-activating protein (RanGAP) involved in mRNA processing and transport
MYSFVRSHNKRLLDELCQLSGHYIQELEVMSLRATYVSIQKLLMSLPNLKTFFLSKGVRNAGMSFELKMIGMSTTDCKSLAHCLTLPMCQLTQLQLPENMIDDEMLQLLLSGLVQSDRIQHLDLSHNKIGAAGCRSLSAFLRITKTLCTLNLCDNNIRTEGCTYLAIAIRQNRSLKELSLRLNRLSDETGKVLFEAITENPVLEYVNLSSNQLATESAEQLASTVLISSKCLSLVRLDLSGNMFGDEGGRALAAGLERCPRRVVLFDIRSCKIRMEEASTINSIVSKNLQYFNI